MIDPFELLGLPRRFALDLAAAEKAHRQLSRALHPDRYAAAGASERRAALQKAADVNEAWRLVRDPVRRAEALFELAGISVGERNEPLPDPDLLMDVLEKREALAEAKGALDAAKVRALAHAVAEQERAVADILAAAPTLDRSLVPKLAELRFHRRFAEEARAVLEQLEPGSA